MKSKVNGVARALLGACALALVLPLASCGGSSTRVETFHASRVIAFGDESSVMTATHKKYTVNGLATGSTTEVDCGLNPIWIQFVAAHYGLVFPECAGLATDPVSRIRAKNGARVADLEAQINEQINLYDGFTSNDIVTVLVGANDLVDIYEANPGASQDQLVNAAADAGLRLAAQVNRLAKLGPRVLISTIPNMGLTPYAGDPSGSRAAVLANMSSGNFGFNAALLGNITNNGYLIGLIQLDGYLQSVYYSGAFANVTLPSCTVALPDCTTLTQVPETLLGSWLWADNLHFGAAAQAGLGSLAISRVQINPF
jgi:hypothetical protein